VDEELKEGGREGGREGGFVAAMEGVETGDLRGEEVGRDSRGRSYYVFPQFYEDCRVFRTVAPGEARKGGRKGEEGGGRGKEGGMSEERGGGGEEEAKGESPTASAAAVAAVAASAWPAQDPPFSVLPRYRKEKAPIGGALECVSDSLPSLLALVSKMNKSRKRVDGELGEVLGSVAQGVEEELEKEAVKEEGFRRRGEKAKMLELLPRRRSRRLAEGGRGGMWGGGQRGGKEGEEERGRAFIYF